VAYQSGYLFSPGSYIQDILTKHSSLSRKSQSDRIIYGVHPILEALTAYTPIEKIFFRKEGTPHARIQDIRNIAKERHIPFQYVPEVKIEQLCGKEVVHQGIAALISPISYSDLEDLILNILNQPAPPLLLMLDAVTDVRNFGAIARTAECMGVQGIILPMKGAAAINGIAIKASAGALHHIPICRIPNLVDAILMLQAYEIRSVAASEKGNTILFDYDFTQPICIVMGAEDKGVSNTLLRRVDDIVTIPMVGDISSLNVSVATGMFLLETVRKRKSFIQP